MTLWKFFPPFLLMAEKTKGSGNKYIRQDLSWVKVCQLKGKEKTFHFLNIWGPRRWELEQTLRATNLPFCVGAGGLGIPLTTSTWPFIMIDYFANPGLYICICVLRRQPHKTFNKWEDRRPPDTQMNSFAISISLWAPRSSRSIRINKYFMNSAPALQIHFQYG